MKCYFLTGKCKFWVTTADTTNCTLFSLQFLVSLLFFSLMDLISAKIAPKVNSALGGFSWHQIDLTSLVCCLKMLCTSTLKAGSLLCQKERICNIAGSLLKALLFRSDWRCIFLSDIIFPFTTVAFISRPESLKAFSFLLILHASLDSHAGISYLGFCAFHFCSKTPFPSLETHGISQEMGSAARRNTDFQLI